ncbi:MAG TPA: vWA domain-containing protein [Polyangiales bacterium]
MRHALKVGLCASLLSFACGRSPQPPALPAVARQGGADAAVQVAVAPKPVAPVARPKIEVVFALDTTGSMGSLIEGAKQKIWAIADELASAQPTPELRIGLVAYRDRGDTYVTQQFALSDDLDAVYAQLMSFQADGGGDGPESVNQALYEAVHQTAWSAEPNVYRAVFLVGDAPPHMDYAQDIPYQASVTEAAERGIVLNTVQCGEMEGTKSIWLAIAHGAQGTYASIAQSGGMQQIAAPMDAEIDRVNAALSGTVVPYGAREKQDVVRQKARLAEAAPAAASASRHAFLEKKGGAIVTGGGDLLDDVREGKVKLESVRTEELPSELRGLTPQQRKEALATRAQERDKLKSRLDTLVKERAAYVRAEQAKQRAAGVRDGFDGEVMKTVKSQAAARTKLTY